MLSLLTAFLLPTPLKELLGDVKSATSYRYNLKDADGRGMDCLEVSQAAGARDYLGVYHSLEGGFFRLYVAQSKNLLDWRPRVKIDDRASQGSLIQVGGKFLLAYEVDRTPGNFIRLRLYPSRAALESGQHERQVDLPAQLSQLAEGTPSFVSADVVTGNIALHFHFLSDTGVDRTSEGTLTNWSNWKSRPRTGLNSALDKVGARGNFGDRTPFTFRGKRYELQEVQFGKYDWYSWRVFLNDLGAGTISRLVVRTHGGSNSFANPNVRFLTLPNGKPGLVQTLFIPSEGSAPGEAGCLLFTKELAE